MIHMRAFMPANSQQKFTQLLQWGKLKHEQLSQAILISKESVLDYLKRQVEKGNWEAVRDVLNGKPMTRAGKLMFSQLQEHIVTNIVMRLGLRNVIAAGIAIIILPLILAKLSGEVINKVRKH